MHSFFQPNRSLFFWCATELGFQCLEYLLEWSRHDNSPITVKGVCISTTDQWASRIEKLAAARGITIYADNDHPPLAIDLGLCVTFPHRIHGLTLNGFLNGVVNLHLAPLPHYRGSGALTHAIINGDKEYGVTLHLMEETLETGPVIAVKWAPLDREKTAFEIEQDIRELAKKFFKESLPTIITNTFTATPQSQLIAEQGIKPQLCTKKSVAELYELSLQWPFEKLYRYVRALSDGTSQKPYVEYLGKRLYFSV